MHQPFNVSARTSKSFVLHGAFIVISLCYLLFNLFSGSKSVHYARKTLSLPEIEQYQINKNQTKKIKKNGWTIVNARVGDSLASVFKRLGLSQQTLLTIIHDTGEKKNLSGIKPNQQIQFLINNQTLEKMVIPLNATQVLIIYLKDKHYLGKINSRETNSHNQYLTATVHGSLYGTAQRMNLPRKLIQQMIEIFNWEIDFAKDIRSGDQFSILYDALYVDDKCVGIGDILAVSYSNRGIIHRAIRHENAAGDVDYFTPDGVSLKKAFSRYPVKFSHISSTFSLSRKHPILHYSRPHKGVDLAAPIGTPIHATGDGRIQILGRQNDYGNMIKISHNKTYSSVYGHLLKFQKGLSKGDYVKRGQVIGYVGQTGLATGPHCHYEFHVNQRPKNPTTIQLPRAAPISTRENMAFKNHANTMLAQLKLYEAANLAGKSDKKSANTG